MNRSSLCAFALLALFTLAPSTTARGQRAADDEITRTFRPRFADVKDLNALLRGVVDVRKTAVNERDQTITVRDSPKKVRAIEDLIEEWDRPAPRWRGRLVAVTATKDEILREFWLENERLSMKYSSDNDWLHVDLETKDLRERSVSLEYEFRARLSMPQGTPSFGREEAGGAAMSGDGEHVVLLASTDLQQQELATLVGASRPVKQIVLRLSPNR